MPLDTPTDQPVAELPGQLDAQQLVNQVLRRAALDCEDVIDTLPVLLHLGRISPAEAQQADRYLTTLAETFREPLRAQGLTLPEPIR